MNQEIIIKIKNTYGRELIYPVNKLAHQFTLLFNKQTFSHEQLNQLQKIGFKITVQVPTLDLTKGQ